MTDLDLLRLYEKHIGNLIFLRGRILECAVSPETRQAMLADAHVELARKPVLAEIHRLECANLQAAE